MNSKAGHKAKNTKNDIFYTPTIVAKRMIDICEITPEMKVLDPCYGGGVFYNNLPECNKHYCEIEQSKDFFDETERYDLIIGNPPYSKWNDWIDQTAKLTDKFCYIFGILNFTPERISRIHDLGFSITKIDVLKVQYWYGQSFIVVCERNNTPSIISLLRERVYCDTCGKTCKRGVNGISVNVCGKPPGK